MVGGCLVSDEPIQFHKVEALPANPEPNAMYFVKAPGANTMQAYVTSNSGTPFALGEEAVVDVLDLGTFN
jgi:hypothetical protein